MRKSKVLTKALAAILCIAMLIPMAVTVGAAETGSEPQATISVSTKRLSMTDQREVALSFNLGYKPEAANLEWSFGDQPFSQWLNWEGDDGEPVFTVKDLTIADNGDVTATLCVDYLFDGDDAAYWRPWYSYRGEYALTVTDKSTGRSASQTMRYEVYDSYTPYSELDSKIQEIIRTQANGLHISYESTGLSTDGKDVMEVIVARDKAVVDNYLALLKRAQTEPEAVAADVRSGRLSDYQVPVYITNIHPNECPAVDQQIEFLKAVATQETIPYLNGDNETCTYNVKDVLNDVFFIIRPTENPYALEHYQRGNVEGFDLNRDSTYQTQIESQVATADLVKWKPVTLMELHGFIYYARTQLQIEPCTPPHEPNLEYDLFMNYALEGARAFGDVASMNSIYNSSSEYAKENGATEDNQPWYDITMEAGYDPATGRYEYPSDDMSTNYTPTYALFHGTIGYTVERGTAWVTTYGTKTTVISNNGLDAVNAVNDLLAKGVTVGFITEAGDHYSKGDFVIDHKDAAQISDQYVIEITHVADVPQARVITEPKVYVDDDSFDRFAFTRQMNFKTVADVSQANVVFSSNEPEEDVKAAVANGLPFVGASVNILEYAKATIPGFDFKIQWIIEEGMYGPEEVYNDYEALFNVEYGDSLITASYAAAGDFTTYTKGGSIISAYPQEATVLMRASSQDDFYKAGWWNGIDDPDGGLKGQVVAIDYQSGGLDMTVFCTSIANKAHQTDDYRLATNAIYSKLLGADFTVSDAGQDEPVPEPVPEPSSPRTGDDMNVVAWTAAAVLSMGMAAVFTTRKKAR